VQGISMASGSSTAVKIKYQAFLGQVHLPPFELNDLRCVKALEITGKYGNLKNLLPHFCARI
jgi:hypothetical protein